MNKRRKGTLLPRYVQGGIARFGGEFDMTHGLILECCDCGLVHELQVRDKDGRLLGKMRRREGLTTASRRLRKGKQSDGR